jgi:branched-chain amino acid transport system permease protein
MCVTEAVHLPFVGTLIATTAVYALASTGLDFIVGSLREISVAQAAAMAFGAYAGFPLIGSHAWLALIIAMFAGAVAGVVIGLPSIRVGGFALATYTLVVGLATTTLLDDVSAFGGTYGRTVIPGSLFGLSMVSDASLTGICVTIAIVGILVHYLLMHSMVGLSWRAVGQNSRMAGSLGVPLPITRLTAFAVGGAFAGIAGMLYAVISGYLSPDNFDFSLSVQLLAIVIIGGRLHPLGGAVGAIFLTLLKQYLPASSYDDAVLGGVLLLVVWLAPRGIAVYVQMFLTWLREFVSGRVRGGSEPTRSPAELNSPAILLTAEFDPAPVLTFGQPTGAEQEEE